MDIIPNLRFLEELDNETAVAIIQLALEDLNQLFDSDQQETNSEARRVLERRRDELQRQLRRRCRIAVGGFSSAVAWPIQEPVSLQYQQARPSETLASDECAAPIYRIPGAWPSLPLPPQDPTTSQQSQAVRSSLLQSEVIELLRAAPQLMCHICRDDFVLTEGLTFSCNHDCCCECLNEIYRGATADESGTHLDVVRINLSHWSRANLC
ncbi:hypothetical protein N431DRAFT_428516 [Stipitochalara longipes BDJ]|nr:hypothetical protein N431DRAFT_428516 [Stipitochalara longipes BDJ]